MNFAVSPSVSAAVPPVPSDVVVALPAPEDVADGAVELPIDGSTRPAFLDVLGLLNAATDVEPGVAEAAPADSNDESLPAEDDTAPVMPAMAAVPAPFVMALPMPVQAPMAGEAAAPGGHHDDAMVSVSTAMEEARPMPGASRPADKVAPRDAVSQQMTVAAAAAADRPDANAPDANASKQVAATAVDERVLMDTAPSTARSTVLTPARTATAAANEFRVEDPGVPLVSAVAPQLADRDPLPAVKLSQATPAQWRQPLAEALGERLQLNLQRGSEQAVIRLEPPQLGRIDIAIRHEAGALQVQLTATHSEVVRQLHAIGDSLRQDLGQRAYGDVSVVVSDGAMGRDAEGRSRGRPQQPDDSGPGRALAEAESGSRTAFRMGDDTSKVR